MSENKNDRNDKFYLFKIDKDKIKLQLKDIGTKIIRRKSRKKGIILVIAVCILIGIGIAINNNYNQLQKPLKDNSGVIIEQMTEPGEDSQEESYVESSGEQLQITDKKFKLNDSPGNLQMDRDITPEESDNAQSRNRNRRSEQKRQQETEGVVTSPVKPLDDTVEDEEAIELLKPVSGEIVQGSGWYYHPVFKDWRYQQGIEIAGNIGDIVMAADSGEVLSVKEDEYKGVIVTVKHSNGWKSLYGHLQKASVSPGEVVGKGQELGRVGETGITTQPLLYFELTNKDEAVTPVDYFK